MDPAALRQKLTDLIATWENEVVEFKEASNDYDTDETVAAASGKKAAYIKIRAFDDQHYADMLVQYLRQFGTASRKDVDDLLWDKLSDALDEAQKANKIGNLLSGLRRKRVIFNAGSKPAPAWKLSE